MEGQEYCCQSAGQLLNSIGADFHRLSLGLDYPYHPEDGRNNPDTEGARVLRGGSWLNDLRFARGAYRYRYPPLYFDLESGFRVVLSLVDAGF